MRVRGSTMVEMIEGRGVIAISKRGMRVMNDML